MKKTGIFSGSFNPIHIGHLALANWLCEFEELDEVWFLVTPLNPLKEKNILIDNQLRYEMVQKAIAGYPKFKVSDFEFTLPQPSYTVHTLAELKKAYPEHDFHFIMGADNWVKINQWKDYETILKNYPILIYPRLGYEVTIPDEYPRIRMVNAPIMEISSSFIRQAFREGKDIRFFLPESIRNNLSEF
ncbi:nicotinate-nucleotide adenylyltransferase [Parabacteroides sp. PF5-5]|uniref:nicotinate (nicotinamide) nucleotide adenylyltransferase n=1 Tax=unclassified Parabacteroides TaxID=2649774 RepID=UPI002473761D|nr:MULTISPECIES: nicotinate (nicotinamide) nucleotide adenylyltransferase [unclassified Parabacteroides]MDH6305140.1 nicotinate-nucleotide adenylyltransferase [Parabacteroides sp. PH5-39]MDH6316490.1 nicotinate-nucleotide adenylyltransferase [Parabacteroides sp. PF5-13]MDH6320000.1 nicotinate-nucleotide adenylyltransferase [Parabacteroides sp. PH5-13]MDH6323767.1 nicotinate-nucleotide adenylyltransferase [Parabacteroides sp. PH5-8]MDH6327677.1 nicotinate-nucleotide adenylyltransferase [Parabac